MDEYTWPLKGIQVEDGLLCIFDLNEEFTTDYSQVSMHVNFVDNEWVVVIEDNFCVPVEMIGPGKKNFCNLYLAGSLETIVEAKIFATIPLDIRALTKIMLIVELGQSTETPL